MFRQRVTLAVAVSVALAAATIVAPAGAQAASAPPTLPANCVQQTLGGTVTCTFASTGAEQSFAVPTGVTSLTVTAVGAAGGQSVFTPTGPPGKGSAVSGAVPVTSGATVYVEVGGTPSTSGCYTGDPCAGGFNGGGASFYGGGRRRRQR